MSQVYKSYQQPLDTNDLWHNKDDNKIYSFNKKENKWLPISQSDSTGTGEPGFSPTVSIEKEGKQTIISITDKDGVHTATINDGEDGPKGETGESPEIFAERVNNGVKLTINNISGSHSVIINDGLGNGNIASSFADVPSDGKLYARKNGTWVESVSKEEFATLGSRLAD